MSGPDLKALLGSGPRSTKLHNLPGDVKRAREAEQRRRAAAAWTLANQALRSLHSEDYDSLLQQARRRVDAEKGALPGDDLIDAEAALLRAQLSDPSDD